MTAANRKPPQSHFRPEEVLEELRDLVSAVEWVLEMEQSDPLYEVERRRAIARIASAKQLVTRLDQTQQKTKGR